MTEILDDILLKNKNQKGYLYTILSLLNAISSIGITYYVLVYFWPNEIRGFTPPPAILIYLLWGLIVSGLIFTYFSFVRTEKFKLVRWTAAVVNVFMFVLLFGSVIFTHYKNMNSGF